MERKGNTGRKLLKILLIGTLVCAGLGAAAYQLGAGNRLAAQLNAEHGSEVVMYSATWCGVCRAAREHMQASGQEFVELDMEQDPRGRQEFAQFGGVGIPLLLVNGRVIRGFKPREMEQALERQ